MSETDVASLLSLSMSETDVRKKLDVEKKKYIAKIVQDKKVAFDLKISRAKRRKETLQTTSNWIQLLPRFELNRFVRLTNLNISSCKTTKEVLLSTLLAHEEATETNLKRIKTKFIKNYGDVIQLTYEYRLYEKERIKFMNKRMKEQFKPGDVLKNPKTNEEHTVTSNNGKMLVLGDGRAFCNANGRWKNNFAALYFQPPFSVDFIKQFALRWLINNVGQTINCFYKRNAGKAVGVVEKCPLTVYETDATSIKFKSMYLQKTGGLIHFEYSNLGLTTSEFKIQSYCGRYEWSYKTWGFLYSDMINMMLLVLKEKTTFGSFATPLVKKIMTFL